MKHTPGPWGTVETLTGHWVLAKSSTAPETIAKVENPSNSSIIAAAPELLEACKIILPIFENIATPDGAENDRAWDLIQKAIETAEGR